MRAAGMGFSQMSFAGPGAMKRTLNIESGRTGIQPCKAH
jgi:hypothetical protein